MSTSQKPPLEDSMPTSPPGAPLRVPLTARTAPVPSSSTFGGKSFTGSTPSTSSITSSTSLSALSALALPPGQTGGPEVAARDRRTLELRQFFRLPRKRGEERVYDTKIWFYFARGFGISPSTWTREEFYQDINVYMRLHAPSLRLDELADLDHPTSPASVLRRALPKLIEPRAPSSESLDRLAKTFGAELADAATSAARAMRARIKNLSPNDNIATLEKDVETLCHDLLRALGAVRRLRAKARAYRTVAPTTLIPSLAFAEEFAGTVIDERLAELAGVVDAQPALRDGKGAAVRLRLMLARTAEEIVRRRVEQGFPLPSGESPEYFTYRHGLLKKEMQRALYVDTRQSTRDPFYRNSAAMVAAGLAATWATLAQLPLISAGLSAGTSVLFMSVGIGAYMLKDRIKEWVRVALSKRLLRFDHDRQIVGDALAAAGLGSFGGRAQERLRWAENDEVPKDIAGIRAKHRTVRGVTPELETVLEYQRLVRFTCGDDPVPDGFGVQELFRLSLDEILKRLDDPVDEIAYYDHKTATFQHADMPKVYHLNLIAQCTDVQTGAVTSARWRVVVNQEGIVHIDPVLNRRKDPRIEASDSGLPLAAE